MAVLHTGHATRVKALALVCIVLEAEGGGGGVKGGAIKGGAGAGATKASLQERDNLSSHDSDSDEGGHDSDSDEGASANPITGLAKLTAETINFSLPGGSKTVLATVGGDGVVFLWDSAVIAARLTAGAGAGVGAGAGGEGPARKKSKSDAAGGGGGALVTFADAGASLAAILVVIDEAPLGKLNAAKGTRPTCALGV